MFTDVSACSVRSYYEDLTNLLLYFILTYERSSFYPDSAELELLMFPLLLRKSNLPNCKVERITKDLNLRRKKAQAKIKLKLV